MERATQDASAGKTFSVLCASMVVITKSHRDERTDLRAAWLAPRPNLALVFRKLPEKKHNASKSGDFASIKSITREGAPQTSMVQIMPYRIPTVRSSRSRAFPRPLLVEILCCMYLAGLAGLSTRQTSSTRRK